MNQNYHQHHQYHQQHVYHHHQPVQPTIHDINQFINDAYTNAAALQHLVVVDPNTYHVPNVDQYFVAGHHHQHHADPPRDVIVLDADNETQANVGQFEQQAIAARPTATTDPQTALAVLSGIERVIRNGGNSSHVNAIGRNSMAVDEAPPTTVFSTTSGATTQQLSNAQSSVVDSMPLSKPRRRRRPAATPVEEFDNIDSTNQSTTRFAIFFFKKLLIFDIIIVVHFLFIIVEWIA